jgi:hypothetical protein
LWRSSSIEDNKPSRENQTPGFSPSAETGCFVLPTQT